MSRLLVILAAVFAVVSGVLHRRRVCPTCAGPLTAGGDCPWSFADWDGGSR